MTNQEFYTWLTDNNYFWDRTSSNEIWVALNGYKCFTDEREALETNAKKAKHINIAQDFDTVCGKTFYRFRHR